VVDYAQPWVERLRFAPNHAAHAGLVARVLLYAGDTAELRRAVFGDE
jgi:hypothetical protein